MKKANWTGIALAAVAAASIAIGQTTSLDPKLPVYQKASGISGNLSSVGSDTMNNLATLWGESFRKVYPSVKIQVEGRDPRPRRRRSSKGRRSWGRCLGR